MPKLKTNRAAAKRFRFTKTGKIKYKKAYHNHILTKKGMKRKRRLRQVSLVHNSNVKEVLALMPYRG